MNRILLLGALLSGMALATPPAAPDSAAFDALLKRYVEENGTVRYGALRMDLAPLSRFVDQIGAVSPDSHPALFPTRAHRLAYWINAYNALVLWAMSKEAGSGAVGPFMAQAETAQPAAAIAIRTLDGIAGNRSTDFSTALWLP